MNLNGKGILSGSGKVNYEERMSWGAARSCVKNKAEGLNQHSLGHSPISAKLKVDESSEGLSQ